MVVTIIVGQHVSLITACRDGYFILLFTANVSSSRKCPASPSRHFFQESSAAASIWHQDGLQKCVICRVNFSDTDPKSQIVDWCEVQTGMIMCSVRQCWDTHSWHQQEALCSSPITDQWMIPHLPGCSPGACYEMTSPGWNYSFKYSWGHQLQKAPHNLASTG